MRIRARIFSLWVCLGLAVVLPSCGGGATTPSPTPTPTPSPTPTPVPKPQPTPDPSATPSARCKPQPPPITFLAVRIHLKNDVFWTLDATPIIGPDAAYCAAVGFSDGRAFCTVRPEGDPLRAECEALVVGHAADTGRPGPTWRRGGITFCTGILSQCENTPDNQYQLKIYRGGLYSACAEGGPCGFVNADKDL